MRHASLTAALVLFAVSIPVSGQQAKPVPSVHQRAAPPVVAAPAAAPRPTDAQIEAAIRLKMAKSKIGADKFHFKVQGGVATIEGKTDVIQRKGAATRMAKTAGAIGVNNHIEISEAAKEKAADNLAKGRRRAQVTRGEPRTASRTTNATLPVAVSKSVRKAEPAPSVQKQ